MDNILKKIINKKKEEVKALKKIGLTEKHWPKYSFFDHLNKPGLSLIAEIKKASPSKGLINPNLNPIKLAKTYASLGASALSVLTDELFFKGHLNYLSDIKETLKLPLLRKDFIIDPIQIKEAKYNGADAILLIISILEENQCQDLIDEATKNDLDVLLEIHSEKELNIALNLKNVKIIGINNRNLKTFETDLNLSQTLIQKIKKTDYKGLIIAESGYHTQSSVDTLSQLNFNGVLIGEGLVKNKELITYFKNYEK